MRRLSSTSLLAIVIVSLVVVVQECKCQVSSFADDDDAEGGPDELQQCPVIGVDRKCECAFSESENNLFCDARDLTELPKFQKSEIQFTFLDVTKNSIRALHGFAFDGLHVESIDLFENNISRIEAKTLLGVSGLRTLNLGMNRIHVLPDDLFQDARELEFFDVTKNMIADIKPDMFKNTPALNDLSIGGYPDEQTEENSLRAVPALSFLKELKRVNLAHNSISEIDKLGTLLPKSVENLDLSNNRIQTVRADTFKGLVNLRDIRLTRNKITHILSKAFEGLVHLNSLKLDGNELTRIPAQLFHGTPRLNLLDLNHNRIEKFEDFTFSKLHELATLHLQHNKITMFSPFTFCGLEKMNYLTLQSNQLAKFDACSFAPIVRNRTDREVRLLLTNNPVDCDCSIAYLRKKFNIEYAAELICHSPAAVKDNSLDSLSNSKLGCDDNPPPPYNCPTCDKGPTPPAKVDPEEGDNESTDKTTAPKPRDNSSHGPRPEHVQNKGSMSATATLSSVTVLLVLILSRYL